MFQSKNNVSSGSIYILILKDGPKTKHFLYSLSLSKNKWKMFFMESAGLLCLLLF